MEATFDDLVKFLANLGTEKVAHTEGSFLTLLIGVYRDLAVGFDPDGADAWVDQSCSALDWSVGAPPDAWNMKGQMWGMPPLNPRALRAAGYRPLTQMLRANMRHAGALRIDHALGLRRLFWIPRSGGPKAHSPRAGTMTPTPRRREPIAQQQSRCGRWRRNP
jgi:4-alpha-glucanotransferase